ncbi:hypothetical protein Tco_0955971 [Tanacetum coccineum]|uniref:MAK10-like protein n=1 Tax=Tanacetum coccineum TaxID=301880 RepID=A0ABQ5E8R1_9ASTR
MGDENPIRTLGEYSKPSHEGYRNTIELPAGNNMVPFRSDTIRPLAPSPFFYDHVNPVTRRTIDQSAGGKLHDRNAEESWALLEDLALYDKESWNDPRDFAKPVKAIALPQDVPSTSDRRLIELENQVQRLMEAYLASTQPTQVNKITTSCEICSGPHDTQYCMEGPEQACVDYASSCTNEMGEKRLSYLRTQLGQQQDDTIRKINLLWKTVSKKLNDVSTPENARNSMAPKSIAAISHVKREELRKKGIKSPSKFEWETEEEVEEVFDDETEKEEDDDTKHYNSPLAIKELVYHEWLLKNPRHSWVKAKIRAENPSNIKISCMIRHILMKHAYIDIESPVNIMSMNQYNRIMTYKLGPRKKPCNPNKISNFVGRVRGLKVFIGSFAYKCDFMVLEDTTSVIDDCLGEFIFGKTFIEETSLAYNKEEGTIAFCIDNEKITFKMPHTLEMFKQSKLKGLNTDFIPPAAYEDNYGQGRTHYYQSLLIGDDYRHDGGYKRGIRHLMRIEKEMMDDKGEVT